MLLGRFASCSIVCPPVVTGGIEAIHQLSEFLNGFGVPCWINYWDGRIGRKGDRLVFQQIDADKTRAAYAGYHPVSRWEVEMRPDHLVILPEILHHKTRGFEPSSVAVWWLSIDNAARVNRKFRDPEWRDAYFGSGGLIHLHQSVYAREVLRRHGVHSHPLGDYTDRRFTAAVPTGPGEGDRVCFNPAKGLPLAQSFFSSHPDIAGLPIDGMTKAEVLEAFRRQPVYVDFGKLPGRDRMPREAAAAGAIVFLHRRGAGALYDDFPIPDFYRFTADEATSGGLHGRIAAVLADPAKHWGEQEMFRQEIRWERAAFRDQVCKLLGRRPDV